MTAFATKIDNECLMCGHEWTDMPGAHSECGRDGCPKCNSLYWKVIKETDVSNDVIVLDNISDFIPSGKGHYEFRKGINIRRLMK